MTINIGKRNTCDFNLNVRVSEFKFFNRIEKYGFLLARNAPEDELASKHFVPIQPKTSKCVDILVNFASKKAPRHALVHVEAEAARRVLAGRLAVRPVEAEGEVVLVLGPVEA